jgi:Protein of unknown function (DUF3307)
VTWVDAFAAFLVAHMVGDYLFQTDWQASHKRGGLTGDSVSRRALLTHVTTYTIAFLPVLVWIASRLDDVLIAVIAGALIFLPHFVVDDGRIVVGYVRRIKRADVRNLGLLTSVDQAFHILSLWAVAILVGAW